MKWMHLKMNNTILQNWKQKVALENSVFNTYSNFFTQTINFNIVRV